MFDVIVKVKSVPGDNPEAIFEELADIIIDMDILPYDYDVCPIKVGELI